MKIAFATKGNDLASPVENRFGRSPKYFIFDLDTQASEVIENRSRDAKSARGARAAKTIIKSGAKIVVAGDCGSKAGKVLKSAGIKVYLAKDGTVKEALDKFISGELPEKEIENRKASI